MKPAWSHFVYTNAFFGRLASRGFQIIASSPGVPDHVVDSILSQLPPDPDFRNPGSAAIFKILRPLPETTVFIRTQSSGDEITRSPDTPRPKNYLSHCLVCHGKLPTWQEYLAVARFSWISSTASFNITQASCTEIALNPPNIETLVDKAYDDLSIQTDNAYLNVLGPLIRLDEDDFYKPFICEYSSSEGAFISFLKAIARLCESKASVVVLQRASAASELYARPGSSSMAQPTLLIGGNLLTDLDSDRNSAAEPLSIVHPDKLHELYNRIDLKIEGSSLVGSIEARAANLLSSSPVWDSVNFEVVCEIISQNKYSGALGGAFKPNLNDIGFLRALEADILRGGDSFGDISRGVGLADLSAMTLRAISDSDADELPGLRLVIAVLSRGGKRAVVEAASRSIEELPSVLESLRMASKALGDETTVSILRKFGKNEEISDEFLWCLLDHTTQFSDGSPYHVYLSDRVMRFVQQNGTKRFIEVFRDWVGSVLMRLHDTGDLDPEKIRGVLFLVVDAIDSSKGNSPRLENESAGRLEFGSRVLRLFGAWSRSGEGAWTKKK